MRLSAPDRRQQLIGVALDLFSQKGYEGTTTREIAERAGVNEAIIYRHFPNKEDLYWAVIEQQCQQPTARQRLDGKLELHTDDLSAFTALAEEMITKRESDYRFSRLLFFAALERHKLSDRFFRTYVSDYFDSLAEHIRKRVQDGIFRPVDPQLAARGFTGMVIYHSMVQELFGAGTARRIPAREAAEGLTRIWLGGMLAANAQENGNKMANRNKARNGNGHKGLNGNSGKISGRSRKAELAR